MSARLQAVTDGMSAWLEARRVPVLALVILASVGLAAVRAANAPLVHDEIYTAELATLPSMHVMWQALQEGVDEMPPGNLLLTRVAVRCFGSGRLALRVAPLLAFGGFCGVVTILVARRAGAMAGLLAAILCFLSGTFGQAAYARGYALMLAAGATTLLAWTESVGGGNRRAWLPVLAGAVAVGVWAHYCSVLVLVPIGAAELVRWGSRRRFDAGVACALIIGLLGFVPLFPLLGSATAGLSTYWHQAQWSDIGATYIQVLGALAARRFWLLGLLVVAIVLAARVFSKRRPHESVPAWHDVVAGVGFLGLPVLAVAIAKVTTGAYVPRYAFDAALGLCVVSPIAFVWIVGPKSPASLCLLAGLSVAFVLAAWQIGVGGRSPQSLDQSRPGLVELLRGPVPVAVTGVVFLEVWYDAPPELRNRLVYLIDGTSAITYVKTDSVEKNYSALRNYVPVHVEPYSEFLKSHPEFYLYAMREFTWQPQKLAADGADLKIVAREGDATIYRVAVRGIETP